MPDLDYLRQWVGKRECRQETIALEPALRVRAMLDDEISPLAPGMELPPLWHWFYFLPDARTRELGEDGHPLRGGFLPPVPLPKRMFAGSQITFHQPLVIGAAARSEREVLSVEAKSGRNGPLVFAQVADRIEQNGRLCVEELQTIAYRDASGPFVPAAAPPSLPAPPPNAWLRTLTPDSVLLFRFSALTFNAHRIHYDRPYALTTEGYPGLLVHGTLVAVLLMDLVRRHDSRRVVSFSFRALAPVFELEPLRLLGMPQGAHAQLVAEGRDGTPATEARIAFS